MHCLPPRVNSVSVDELYIYRMSYNHESALFSL